MSTQQSKRYFEDKVAAITGAGSGIGRELALQLAEYGCHLAISDINAESLRGVEQLLRDSGVKVVATVLDVSDRVAVDSWATEAVAEHGRVNLIFNNAGVAVFDTVELGQRKDTEWLMNINFWGVINGTTAFLPHIRAAGEGHVINVSSLYGIIGQPGHSAYNAAKFAVRGFTEALRQELELDASNPGVSASCVHPGGISTNIANSGRYGNAVVNKAAILQQSNQLLSRTSPKQAASIILKGVTKNKRRILIGNDARFMDLIQRVLPSGYQWLSVKLAQKTFFSSEGNVRIAPK